jgi:riboflavin synthase
MFTGLIERIGVVKSAVNSVRGLRLEISVGEGSFEIGEGDSVAVDGVCLTATSLKPQAFVVDVSAESVLRTTLKTVKTGDRVNLERALRLGDRLGGHLVSGHVDAVGKIAETRPQGAFARIAVTAPPEIINLTVEKGSIALDGISLTVNKLDRDRFHLTVIPETLARTTLCTKRPGDLVNLETDLIGKYVARLLHHKPPSATTDSDLMRKLAEEGFL